LGFPDWRLRTLLEELRPDKPGGARGFLVKGTRAGKPEARPDRQLSFCRDLDYGVVQPASDPSRPFPAASQ